MTSMRRVELRREPKERHQQAARHCSFSSLINITFENPKPKRYSWLKAITLQEEFIIAKQVETLISSIRPSDHQKISRSILQSDTKA